MNNIENFILNSILILFPMLIYGYFIAYRQNLKKEKIDVLQSAFLYISFYLAIYYEKYSSLEYQYLSIIIPVIIAYLYNNKKDALFMSTIVALYSFFILKYPLHVILPFLLTLFLFYKYYSKRNKSKLFFTIGSSIIVIVSTLINALHTYNLDTVIVTCYALLIYIICIIIISIGIEEANNVINLHNNLKHFEKEKELRLSIFKITHEIKNPLAVIKGYLDMFDINDKSKSERYLSIINNELVRTLNLLNDFLEFSKIKINKQETNFNALMDEIKDILIPLFNAKRIEYYFKIESNIIVNIDAIRMKQVILNIIKNAIEACESDEGIVRTTIFKDGDLLVISVIDNGEGMAKETLDKITTPFVTTKDYGTGLGVSLSNEIIKAHKGNLSYSSVLKKGTICKIVLPIED